MSAGLDAVPVAAVRGRGISVPDRLLPWIGTALVLGAFELIGQSGILFSSDYIPTLTEIVRALAELVGSADFWRALSQTVVVAAAGFLLGAVVGIPLGIAIGVMPIAYRSVRLVIEFLRPVPAIAILPLAVLLFGTGAKMMIYVVAFGSFFPLLFQSLYGVQDVDPVARDTGRAYGLSARQRFVYISVPSATPYVATGVRLSATLALVITVGQELLVGSSGLGYAINEARYASDIPKLYALLVAIGLVGLTLTVGLRIGERWLLRWHASQRSGTGQ